MESDAALLLRNCPVCGGSAKRPFAQKDKLTLVRCDSCSMLFADPVPRDLGTGAYYGRTAAGYYLSKEKLESDYAAVRFERELRLFRRFCRTGSVLDVGCSTGAFLHQLSDRFPGDYQVTGTDVSGPPLDYAESKGIRVLRGNFPEQDIGEEQFDAITFWAVLEHLLEPGRFLEKAARLLKPDGHAFVLVPNMRSLAARILGTKYRYIYPEHLNYFTRGTLGKLVKPWFTIV